MALIIALTTGTGISAANHTGHNQDHSHDHSSHDHSHDHDHDHSHDHGQEVSGEKIKKGYFEDTQVEPRPLSNWRGEWQSLYPLLISGELNPVIEHKVKLGDKTAEEYMTYYSTGYKTDVNQITIKENKVTFHRDSGKVQADYTEDGYEILTYEKGNRGVRYIFKKSAGDETAPEFIQFSDHKIAPETSDHFHLYWGNDRAALLKQLTNWPTYFPTALTSKQIVTEMLSH